MLYNRLKIRKTDRRDIGQVNKSSREYDLQISMTNSILAIFAKSCGTVLWLENHTNDINYHTVLK